MGPLNLSFYLLNYFPLLSPRVDISLFSIDSTVHYCNPPIGSPLAQHLDCPMIRQMIGPVMSDCEIFGFDFASELIHLYYGSNCMDTYYDHLYEMVECWFVFQILILDFLNESSLFCAELLLTV